MMNWRLGILDFVLITFVLREQSSCSSRNSKNLLVTTHFLRPSLFVLMLGLSLTDFSQQDRPEFRMGIMREISCLFMLRTKIVPV